MSPPPLLPPSCLQIGRAAPPSLRFAAVRGERGAINPSVVVTWGKSRSLLKMQTPFLSLPPELHPWNMGTPPSCMGGAGRVDWLQPPDQSNSFASCIWRN